MLCKDQSFVFETTYEGLENNAVAESGIEEESPLSTGSQKGKPLISNETVANVSSTLATSMTTFNFLKMNLDLTDKLLRTREGVSC